MSKEEMENSIKNDLGLNILLGSAEDCKFIRNFAV